MINWGIRLEQILDRHGIKQYELAEKLGVTAGNVSQICGKSTFQLELAEQICNALKIHLSEFTDIEGNYKVDYVALGLDEIDIQILQKIKQLPEDKRKKFLIAVIGFIDLL